MFVLVNILEAVVYVAVLLLNAYSIVLVVVCLMSWLNPDPYNPIVRLLRNLTEPLLWRIRKYLPFTYSRGMDFSPLVLLILIQLVERIVIKSLAQAIRLL